MKVISAGNKGSGCQERLREHNIDVEKRLTSPFRKTLKMDNLKESRSQEYGSDYFNKHDKADRYVAEVCKSALEELERTPVVPVGHEINEDRIYIPEDQSNNDVIFLHDPEELRRLRRQRFLCNLISFLVIASIALIVLFILKGFQANMTSDLVLRNLAGKHGFLRPPPDGSLHLG